MLTKFNELKNNGFCFIDNGDELESIRDLAEFEDIAIDSFDSRDEENDIHIRIKVVLV
jgi:hypothetical protein